MDVPVEKRAEFFQKLQANVAEISVSENVMLANVLDNVVTVFDAQERGARGNPFFAPS